MDSKHTEIGASRVGDFDRKLEENLDLRPADPAAVKGVKLAIEAAAKLPGGQLVEIVKAVATIGGWLWQKRKSERAQAFLLGLYERLERTRSTYIERDEFYDLFEDAIRRSAEQPDPVRREKMGAIFFKIIEAPRDHVENRLLLRLADELPVDALKLLSTPPPELLEAHKRRGFISAAVAAHLGISSEAARGVVIYLANANLIDESTTDVRSGFAAEGEGPAFTSLAMRLVEYMRG